MIWINKYWINLFSTCRASRWNLSLSYNAHLEPNNYCHESSVIGRALFFYPKTFLFLLPVGNGRFYTVNSRQLVTNSLDPSVVELNREIMAENDITCEPEVTTTTTADEVTTESERTTNLMEKLLTTTTHEATIMFTSTDVPTPTSEATTIISTNEVPRTEGTLSSTAVPEMETVTEAEMTEPATDIALQSSIQLAVIGSREGLGLSNLQVLIQVCNLNVYALVTPTYFSIVNRGLVKNIPAQGQS